MRENSELTLRDQRDFVRIYKKGKSRGSRYVVVLYRKNGLDYTRKAFVSSKKVGNSVERNRSRRLMREAYGSFADKIAPGYDIIMVARSTIAGVSEKEVEKTMYQAMKSCGLIV